MGMRSTENFWVWVSLLAAPITLVVLALMGYTGPHN